MDEMPRYLDLITTRQLLEEIKSRAEKISITNTHAREALAIAHDAEFLLTSMPRSILDYKTLGN